MNVEIIDLLNQKPPKQPKKIELVACLQTRNSNNEKFFYESIYAIGDSVKLIRVAKHREFDLILKDYGTGEPLIFLGHWNDGVI